MATVAVKGLTLNSVAIVPTVPITGQASSLLVLDLFVSAEVATSVKHY